MIDQKSVLKISEKKTNKKKKQNKTEQDSEFQLSNIYWNPVIFLWNLKLLVECLKLSETSGTFLKTE